MAPVKAVRETPRPCRPLPLFGMKGRFIDKSVPTKDNTRCFK